MKGKKSLNVSLALSMVAAGIGLTTQQLVSSANATTQVVDAASQMPSLENKQVLVGYWHNWAPKSDGYQQGTGGDVKLSETPAGYNVIDVAFMKADATNRMPTFKPYNMTDSAFRAEVAKLNAQGRAVIISLGGADAHIQLRTGDERPLADEIIRLVETYGFDGLDIDLEQNAITAGDNQTVIPAALKLVKDHYRAKGQNFLITMAPEFPYLRTGGKYVPYVQSLDSYYDFIHPQLYNQGGDGVTAANGRWLAQNNDAVKEDFLYTISTQMATGNGFVKIPAHKLALGLPSNPDAAANGYVRDPQAIQNALNRLAADGNRVKGLMTWSINWDAGVSKSGVAYNNGFVNTYGPMIHNSTPLPTDTTAPSVPSNLQSSSQTSSTISLQWTASTDNRGVREYEIYRGTTKVGTSTTTTFTDSNLTANTAYSYTVKAVDTSGNVSGASAALSVTTKVTGPTPNHPAWTTGVSYKVGEKVTYNGKTYECTYAHTSHIGWVPDLATTLWKVVQ
ncbi:chitinase [Priestia taiwanensis]|uniref:chitinase n=2 Tax=Priestia taiwanensis TaxID=1347902 RepID=A0A917ASK8_9BACI|nr:chitinase [Priestia taiwanensis]